MAVIDTEHERKRLDVLRSYGILDTPPDNGFDEITALAASIFEVPIALISLVDKDRQWYKSKVGFDVSEAPREASFCDAAIQSSEVMVVTDVTQDPRFMHHPLVTGETEIRFYAGAPLLTAEGYVLGTLCVIDRVARGMSQQQRVTLTLLSRQVVTLLALRKKSDELSGAFVTLQNLHHGLQETQTKLHESEQRLLFALDAAEIGDWNMDLRTNVALRSLRHDQCFGYTEAVPKWGYDTFLEHVHPADRQRVDALYSLAMGGQGNYDVDFRVIWPDGTERCLWSRGRFDFDDLGKPYRVAGIQLDITERKQSEAALIAAKEKAETANQELARSNADLVRSQTALTATNQQLEAQNMLLDESEVRLAGVIDSAHDAIISIDSRHKIVLFNPAAQKMFGHAEAAMLGQTLDALLPQQFRAQHSDHVRSFVREDTSSQRMGGARQLYGLRSDGTEFPIEASISRFRSNAQWQSTVILRDITARKNTELKLQRSENLFSKAEELASIGSWDWDLTGEDSIWSDALFTIYGREKSLGVPKFEAWQETIHPDDHEPLETLINHALTDKRNYATEFRIHTKDTGELRYIDSRGEAVLDGDGKVIRIRGVDQDITERKQAESLLRLLEASVAHLNDAVIITAAAQLTAPGPRIVFVNEAAERMTGYTRAELIGQTPRLFQAPAPIKPSSDASAPHCTSRSRFLPNSSTTPRPAPNTGSS